MPVVGLAIGGIASAVGGALSARGANQSSMIGPIPAPKPINPQLNSLYQGLVGGSTGVGATSAGTIKQMAANGMPTDVIPNYLAMLGAAQRSRAEGQANILEQFGSKGLRFGTTTATALSDYNAQSDKDLLSMLSNYLFQTQESAANRQLQAAEFGMSDFSQNANAMYQQYVPKVGQASPTGAAAQGIGSMIQMISLLKLLK